MKKFLILNFFGVFVWAPEENLLSQAKENYEIQDCTKNIAVDEKKSVKNQSENCEYFCHINREGKYLLSNFVRFNVPRAGYFALCDEEILSMSSMVRKVYLYAASDKKYSYEDLYMDIKWILHLKLKDLAGQKLKAKIECFDGEKFYELSDKFSNLICDDKFSDQHFSEILNGRCRDRLEKAILDLRINVGFCFGQNFEVFSCSRRKISVEDLISELKIWKKLEKFIIDFAINTGFEFDFKMDNFDRKCNEDPIFARLWLNSMSNSVLELCEIFKNRSQNFFANGIDSLRRLKIITLIDKNATSKVAEIFDLVKNFVQISNDFSRVFPGKNFCVDFSISDPYKIDENLFEKIKNWKNIFSIVRFLIIKNTEKLAGKNAQIQIEITKTVEKRREKLDDFIEFISKMEFVNFENLPVFAMNSIVEEIIFASTFLKIHHLKFLDFDDLCELLNLTLEGNFAQNNIEIFKNTAEKIDQLILANKEFRRVFGKKFVIKNLKQYVKNEEKLAILMEFAKMEKVIFIKEDFQTSTEEKFAQKTAQQIEQNVSQSGQNSVRKNVQKFGKQNRIFDLENAEDCAFVLENLSEILEATLRTFQPTFHRNLSQIEANSSTFSLSDLSPQKVKDQKFRKVTFSGV